MSQVSQVLEITLLGAPRLLLNGKPLDGVRRKNRALIYYLAAHDRPVSRENLLAFFWPDHERTAAQQILRTMIHDLRKQLGENFRVDSEILSLAPEVKIDLRTFSKTLHSPTINLQSYVTALALYGGDFLDGFSLTDSPEFDEWVASEREHYRLMAMHGFAHLSQHYENLRDFPAALKTMRRALSFDAFQEDLQRDTIRLLYLNGDRTGVVRQYESLRKLLDEELGVLPMPETRALYDSLITDTYTRPQPLPSLPLPVSQTPSDESVLPFVGRIAELETFENHISSGKLILLEGEPGIGKTRLASELITSHCLRDQTTLVLRGVAYELEQGLPYQPLIAALRDLFTRQEWKPAFAQLDLSPIWLTELARLLPEILVQFPHLPSPNQPADEARLWESLLQLLDALSHHGKIWLFLDDLHWADAATIGWLGYFIRHAASSTYVLLATTRPVDGRSSLAKLFQALTRENRFVRIPLTALSLVEMQTMATSLSSAQIDPLSNWLVENAEGNPYFLTELVRYAQYVGLLNPDGTLDLELFNTSTVLPPTIQNLIESRLLHLSEKARQILHLAAIIGREFDFELVGWVAALPESEVIDAIEEVQAARLIQTLAGGKFTFDHSLTMQVVLQDIGEMRQRLLHRQLAEALEKIHQAQLDPVSGLIAHHFIQGSLPSLATPYAFRAGQFAANLAAWMEAIAFYEQALVLEADEAQHAPIFLAMGTARFHKGDFVPATDNFYKAVQLSQAHGDLHLLEESHLALNLAFMPQARFTEAVAVARELRASGPPELALCAEFIWGTGLGVGSAHPTEAEYHLREAERLLNEQAGFPSQISLAQIKYQLAGVVGQQGRSKETIELYRQVLSMLNQHQAKLDILRNIMLYNNLAYHLHLIGDISAGEYTQAGIQLAQEKGSLTHLPYLYSTSGEIALAHVDLDAAERYFTDGLSIAERVPVPERIAGLTANLGLVACSRGDSALARERLTAALELAKKLGTHHLEVRIRIWLAPLLPTAESRICLTAAQKLAEQSGLNSLLEEISQLLSKISDF